jgi:hypothetical protein
MGGKRNETFRQRNESNVDPRPSVSRVKDSLPRGFHVESNWREHETHRGTVVYYSTVVYFSPQQEPLIPLKSVWLTSVTHNTQHTLILQSSPHVTK